MNAPALRRRVLYLSYDGLLDPLGRSQILPYLERFSARNVELRVISFEKVEDPRMLGDLKDKLAGLGITWLPLRYHLKPPVLSTAWDIGRGIATARATCKNWRPDIIHARSYVAALIAVAVKRRTRAAFLFDIRGFWPEEKVEGGAWKPGSLIYRVTKWWEQRFFKTSDAVVILSERGREILQKRMIAWKVSCPVVVIPTCVDLERFLPPAQKPGPNGATRLAYVGSVGTCYLLPEMAAFYSAFREEAPHSDWLILTGREEGSIARDLAQLDAAAYDVRVLTHEAVPRALATAHASLCLIKPVSSKLACCPTKVGESLACGLPVVINRGVGDCDSLIENERVGVVLEGFNAESYRKAARQLKSLIAEGPALRERCRSVARSVFDIEQGTERYLALYETLAAKGRDS